MMNAKSKVILFIDSQEKPIGEFDAPVRFDLDTQKLTDGDHTLKVVSKSSSGREGIRIIPFVVRNGPAISIEGIASGDVVDGILPVMISAYGKGDQKRFIIEGSETPRSIPSWLWVALILFLGWAAFYFITSLQSDNL